MADFTSEKQMAYDAIVENGTTIVIKKYTKGVYDPVADSSTGATWTNYSRPGLLSRYKQSDIDGSNVRKGDMKVLIPALNLDITLEEGDKITTLNKNWLVIDPGTIQPSTDPIIYKAQVRV